MLEDDDEAESEPGEELLREWTGENCPDMRSPLPFLAEDVRVGFLTGTAGGCDPLFADGLMLFAFQSTPTRRPAVGADISSDSIDGSGTGSAISFNFTAISHIASQKNTYTR